jgi:hypothetical protein
MKEDIKVQLGLRYGFLAKAIGVPESKDSEFQCHDIVEGETWFMMEDME